jgi:hypothetical protein
MKTAENRSKLLIREGKQIVPAGYRLVGSIDTVVDKLNYCTVKLPDVVKLPPGVVMVSGPLVAPAGTVAQT